MKKQSLYYVVIRPEYINIYQSFKGRVVEKDGSILCRSIEHGDHFLKVEAHMGELQGDGHWFYLSIHHSMILYIISHPDDNVKQILGCHASQESANTPKNCVAH